MLNESHVEGVIASKWSYNEVQFVRVAVYPDAGRTTRRADPQGRDAPDYVTLRCEGSHALAAASLREGDRVRVSGILTSREYDIFLDAFARKAHGDEKAVAELRDLAGHLGRDVALPHVINEVIVERLIVVETAAERQAGRERRREGRPSTERPAPAPHTEAAAMAMPVAAG
jgi:hypothetical protein